MYIHMSCMLRLKPNVVYRTLEPLVTHKGLETCK